MEEFRWGSQLRKFGLLADGLHFLELGDTKADIFIEIYVDVAELQLLLEL